MRSDISDVESTMDVKNAKYKNLGEILYEKKLAV